MSAVQMAGASSIELARDDQLAGILRAAATRPVVRPWAVPVQEYRAAGAHLATLAGQAPPVASVENHVIDGPGGPLPLRVYRPSAVGPHPTLVFAHGGSFVRGDLNTHDTLCRHLVTASRTAVVAVGYRLAPEHPHPAAIDDLDAALGWIRDGGAADLDRDRVAIGGDSAGGWLAVAVAQRHRRAVPPLRAQVLLNPVIDLTASRPSHAAFGYGYLVDPDAMRWCVERYLDGIPPDLPELSPLSDTAVKGLPPALVVTAELDPVRDEGEAYALHLARNGVPATLMRVPGMVHNFLLMTGALDRSRTVLRDIGQQVGALLTCPSPDHPTPFHTEATMTDTTPAEDLIVTADSGEYVPFEIPGATPGGFTIKLLNMDAANGPVTGIIRMQAGTAIPRHYHTKVAETHYILEGDFINEGRHYGPGAFFAHAANVEHGPHGSQNGCVLVNTQSAWVDEADFHIVAPLNGSDAS